MLCQLCGKKIGPLRRLVDREFCSAAHRHEARASLDRSLADIDDTDVPWAAAKTGRRGRSTSAHTASALLLVVVVLLLLATLSYSGGPPSYPVGPSTKPAESSGWFRRLGDSISRMVRSTAPSSLKDDFHSGLSEWVASGLKTAEGWKDSLGSSNDWSYTPSGLKPGRLRIWKRSTELKNYEVDFLGSIDKKSIGWAFRALDLGNYYATKLTILRSGDGPNAGMVRYVMLNGHEMDRVNLPLPLNLKPEEPYRVRVNVKGDHFITSVNGQVISSWSDQRLRRGGVGFFTDDGESATVRWVSISERDSLLGKVLSYFSLIQFPAAPEE